MATCIVLANAAHWLMLIILRSNYLTIIAISLMIILPPLLLLFSVFQWCRLYGLDHLFATRVFPKNPPKGVLLSLSVIPLAYQDILRTFKQKDVKEKDAALLQCYAPKQMPQCQPLPPLGPATRSGAASTTMGREERASLLSPSWTETALVIAVEQEWI